MSNWLLEDEAETSNWLLTDTEEDTDYNAFRSATTGFIQP